MKFLKSLCGFCPVLLFMGIQFGLAFAWIFAIAIYLLATGGADIDMIQYANRMQEMYMNQMVWIMFAYESLTILIFGCWYGFAFVRKSKKWSPARAITPKSVAAVIIGMFGCYLFSMTFMDIVAVLFPKMIESYNETMESSGLTTGFGLVIAIVMAPIAEELVLRGVTVRLFKWAGLSMVATMILQAILFSVMHMQPLQMCYTLVVGLLLGYFAIRYDSIWISILGHLTFNFLGTIVSGLLDEAELSMWMLPLLMVVSFGCIAAAVILCRHDKRAEGRLFGVKSEITENPSADEMISAE